jgi:hypothetical protein
VRCAPTRLSVTGASKGGSMVLLAQLVSSTSCSQAPLPPGITQGCTMSGALPRCPPPQLCSQTVPVCTAALAVHCQHTQRLQHQVDSHVNASSDRRRCGTTLGPLPWRAGSGRQTVARRRCSWKQSQRSWPGLRWAQHLCCAPSDSPERWPPGCNWAVSASACCVMSPACRWHLYYSLSVGI